MASKKAEVYRHDDEALLRPDVGTQAQFKKKKAPKTYRYDSSLSPALDWDGQNPARERGEELLRRIQEAATLEEAQDAAAELARLGRPFLDWAGKAERLSFDVPTLPLFVHERLSTKAILETLRNLSIKAKNPELDVTSMSGGNQQKVVIGKALMTGPKVLLMDEPSRGIDVGAKADVFRTMRQLAGEGLAILFSTSDLEEVMALSDRIAVMSNGKLVTVVDRKDATEEMIVSASAAGYKTKRMHA